MALLLLWHNVILFWSPLCFGQFAKALPIWKSGVSPRSYCRHMQRTRNVTFRLACISTGHISRSHWLYRILHEDFSWYLAEARRPFISIEFTQTAVLFDQVVRPNSISPTHSVVSILHPRQQAWFRGLTKTCHFEFSQTDTLFVCKMSNHTAFVYYFILFLNSIMVLESAESHFWNPATMMWQIAPVQRVRLQKKTLDCWEYGATYTGQQIAPAESCELTKTNHRNTLWKS